MLSDNVPYVRKIYTGVGAYTFDFKMFDTDDLYVTHTDATGTATVLTTGQYNTVLDPDYSGGVVTVTDALIPYPGFITFQRILPYSQDTDWGNNDPFSMELLERTQDKLVMLLQQLRYNVANSTSVWRGTWITTTAYDLRDFIIGPGEVWYICLEAHTSGVFATDVAAGKWTKATLLADFNNHYNTLVAASNQASIDAIQTAEDRIIAEDSAAIAESSAAIAEASEATTTALITLLESDTTAGDVTINLAGKKAFHIIKVDPTVNKVLFSDTSGKAFVCPIQVSQQWEIANLRLITAGWVRV